MFPSRSPPPGYGRPLPGPVARAPPAPFSPRPAVPSSLPRPAGKPARQGGGVPSPGLPRGRDVRPPFPARPPVPACPRCQRYSFIFRSLSPISSSNSPSFRTASRFLIPAAISVTDPRYRLHDLATRLSGCGWPLARIGMQTRPCAHLRRLPPFLPHKELHALFPQQCLYFFPLPQGQGALRPTFSERTACACLPPPSPSTTLSAGLSSALATRMWNM